MNDSVSSVKAFDPVAAQAYFDENRPEEAVAMAEARLNQFPEDMDAKVILCQGLLRLGRLERLQMLLREIDETICRLSRVYLRLGELCRKSGLQTESDSFMKKYDALAAVLTPEDNQKIKKAPGSPVEEMESETTEEAGSDSIAPEFYTLTLADLYLRQGHPEQAREVLETILSRDPDNEQAAIKLTELAGTLTEAGPVTVSEEMLPQVVDNEAVLVAKLEGWLARVEQLRSPGL